MNNHAKFGQALMKISDSVDYPQKHGLDYMTPTTITSTRQCEVKPAKISHVLEGKESQYIATDRLAARQNELY